MSYLKIQYRNSCDLGGSLFQDPAESFYYCMFLNVDVGKPTFEVIEEGREDGERNFIPDLRKLSKQYKFITVVPEYQLDTLYSIMLHDTVFITLKNGESNRAFNFKVTPGEWTENGNMISVVVEFTVRYDLSLGCCTNEPIRWVDCYPCTDITVVDWVSNSDFVPSADRAIYMIGEENSEGEIINNLLYMYRYTTALSRDGITRSNWIIRNYSVGTVICFTISSTDYTFIYDGTYWQPINMVRSAVASGGTTVTVKGYMLDNTFAQLYKSTDDITYTAVGSPVSDGLMYNVGVTATGLTPATPYYFKFKMYNNSCDYGYSDTVTVTP